MTGCGVDGGGGAKGESGTGGLLEALAMAALRTWARAGFMPQVRQGGSGVCALARVGSKLEGTGLGKLQMVQTHVAALGLGGGAGVEAAADKEEGAGDEAEDE